MIPECTCIKTTMGGYNDEECRRHNVHLRLELAEADVARLRAAASEYLDAVHESWTGGVETWRAVHAEDVLRALVSTSAQPDPK